MYLPEGACLVLSFAMPFVGWLFFHDGTMLARFGGLSIIFAGVAEFIFLNRVNAKHLQNALRVRNGRDPADFSAQARLVGIISLVAAIVGTLVWAFGDIAGAK